MKTVKNILAAVIVALSFTMVSCEKEDSGRPGDNDVCIIGQTWKVDSAFLVINENIFFDSKIDIPENLTYSFYLDSIVVKENNQFMTKLMKSNNIVVDCENNKFFGATETIGFGLSGAEFILKDDVLGYRDPYTGGYSLLTRFE